MFNKTLKNIAQELENNLFNPDQSSSPQSWHVPREYVYDIMETPDTSKTPRVVFALGVLEVDLRSRMEAFNEQPERKVRHESIRPAEHGYKQNYTLQEKPIKPLIQVRAVKIDGTRIKLQEEDDFVVDYNQGEITFREAVNDIEVFRIRYWTDEVIGPATTILLAQPFSIEVVGDDPMKAEAISAIVIGVLEAFKENILAKKDNTYEGLNITALLNPIDLQLVNKEREYLESNGSIITLFYRIPGIMHIAKKIAAEELGIIRKIYHPDVVASDHDVDIEVETIDT